MIMARSSRLPTRLRTTELVTEASEQLVELEAMDSLSAACPPQPGAEELSQFYDWYKDYHGYLAVIVCAFGIVANTLNIAVLTRHNMVTATNCILTGLAISDGLTMVAYLPFALRFYVLYGTAVTPERNTLGAVRFMLFYACFSVVAHTVSIWLTVTLAIFRCICVKYPRKLPPENNATTEIQCKDGILLKVEFLA